MTSLATPNQRWGKVPTDFAYTVSTSVQCPGCPDLDSRVVRTPGRSLTRSLTGQSWVAGLGATSPEWSKPMYLQTFRVHGEGYFPSDMLRYDRCYPADQDAVVTMGESRDKRSLKLARRVSSKTEMPTLGRWQSFGWTVEQASVVTMKI